MISTKYPMPAGLIEDPVEESTYLAAVHIDHGELVVPGRVLAHLADGPVTVRIARSENDVTSCEAMLSGGSKLTGIEWPADVERLTRVIVACPKGAAGHEVVVVLPPPVQPLELATVVIEPVTAEPEPEPDEEIAEPEDEPVAAEDEPDPWNQSPVWPFEEADAETTAVIAAVEETGFMPAEGTLPGLAVVEQDEEEEEPFGLYDDEPTAAELASGEVLDLDHDYRLRWRRALAWTARKFTLPRTVIVTAVVAIVATWGVAWLVMGR